MFSWFDKHLDVAQRLHGVREMAKLTVPVRYSARGRCCISRCMPFEIDFAVFQLGQVAGFETFSEHERARR